MGSSSLLYMNLMLKYTGPFLFALAFMATSCQEVGPNIDLGGPGRAEGLIDTTYVATTIETPQTKKVLLEDFTGVRCKNCPLGAAQASTLLATYPDRLVVIAQHSRFLATPYTGDPDMRTDFSQSIEEMLAPVLGKPSAAIDRRIFPSETAILQPSIGKWANLVNQQVGSATTPVNLYVETDWNSANRSLKVTVTLHYTGTETGENRLSVCLLEDKVIAAQLQPDDAVDSNYVQRHSLRTMLTRFNGELLNTDKSPGRVIIKEFLLEDITAEWNANELEIVAFVSRSAGSFEVLQVEKVKVQ